MSRKRLSIVTQQHCVWRLASRPGPIVRLNGHHNPSYYCINPRHTMIKYQATVHSQAMYSSRVDTGWVNPAFQGGRHSITVWLRLPACFAGSPRFEPKFNFHLEKLSCLSIACDVQLEGASYSVFDAEAIKDPGHCWMSTRLPVFSSLISLGGGVISKIFR